MGGEFSARVNIKTPGTLEEPGVIAGTFLHCLHVCVPPPGRKN